LSSSQRIRGYTILKQADALREAEESLKQFTVLTRMKRFCAMPYADAQRTS